MSIQMTVGELAEKLAKFPQDALVLLEDDEGWIYSIDELKLEEIAQTDGPVHGYPYWYHKDDMAVRNRCVQLVQAVMVNP